MATSELTDQCVLTSGVPKEYTKSRICETVQRHLKGHRVLNVSRLHGEPEKSSKWILQLSSKEAAKKLYNDVVQDELYVDGDQKISIRYGKPQRSQIPESWQYVQENVKLPSHNDPPMNIPSMGAFQNPGQDFYPNTGAHFGFGAAAIPNQGNLYRQAAPVPNQGNQFPTAAPIPNQGNLYRQAAPVPNQGHMYRPAAPVSNPANQFPPTWQTQGQTHPGYRYPTAAPDQLNPGYPYPDTTPVSSQPYQGNQCPVTARAPLHVNPGNPYSNIPFRPAVPPHQPFPVCLGEQSQAPYPQMPMNAYPLMPGYPANYGQGYAPYPYPHFAQMHAPGPYLPMSPVQQQPVFTSPRKDSGQEHEEDREICKEKDNNLNMQTKSHSSETRRHMKLPDVESNKVKRAQEEEESTHDSEDLDTSIKVEGVKSIPAKQNLEFYFESHKRSGGGDIECVRYDVLDEDVMYIQYKQASDARAVLARTHTFSGQKLLVSPCASLPYSDDKVLIEGVKTDTTRDCLFNFLEVKANCTPIDMHVNADDRTVVLVIMERQTGRDFHKLEQACGRHKLEGASLSVSRVPVSNCILVTNLPPRVTCETLQYYFENQRKSDGGPVEKVKLNEDRSACVVYFENYKDIENVLKKTHQISNVRLKVEQYQQCMGLPQCFTTHKKIDLPNDFTLKTVNPQQLKFLRKSTSKQKVIEEQLRTCKASMNFPSDEEAEITFKCTITEPTQDDLSTIEHWKEDVTEIFTNFLEGITVNETVAPHDDWQKVLEKLKSINIDNPELVIVEVNANNRTIVVFGEKKVAESLFNEIENIVEEQVRVTDLKNRITKEMVTTLKPIECRMLNLIGFPQAIMDTYSTTKVSIDEFSHEIVFEGTPNDIKEAQLKMYETRNKFGITRFEVPDFLSLRLYQSDQTKKYISQVIQERQLQCMFEVTGGTVTVYSESNNTIDKCVKVIRRAVVLHKVEINKDSAEYLQTVEFEQKIEELQHKNEGMVHIEICSDANCVGVCALENILEDVVCEIDEDISKNASLQTKVNCSRNEGVFIELYKKTSLTDISQKLQTYRVKIYPVANRTGFIIKGPEEGISRAKEQIQALLKSVKHKDHTFRKPGFGNLITTPKGNEHLNIIEKDLSCLIAIQNESDDSSVKPRQTGKGQSLNIFATCRMHDKIEIQTVQCDITEISVSMIVNSTDEKLSMSHGLGKILAIKGGREVKDSCCDFIAANGKLKECQVFPSPAGKLSAKYILHVTVPNWQRGHGAKDKLNTAIMNCLQKADKYSVGSIAIPAVGCGAARYPADCATDIIVAAIEEFFRHKKESTVTKIILCDMKHGVVEEFTRALVDEFGRKNVKVLKKDEKRDHRDSSNRKQDKEVTGTHGRRRMHSENVDKVLLGNITLSVMKGSVAKQKVDAIVNIVDKALDLKRGTISASLLNNGGPELQQELQTKYPNGLEDGQIAVTSGQKLSCRHVIHGRLGAWDGGNKDSSIESLHTFMKRCLAEAQQQNVSSIVFPAIGTGKLGYPKEVAAKEMISSIADFSNDNQQSTLKEVRIVIFQDDFATIKAFEEESSFWETGERHCPRELRNVYQDIEGSDIKTEHKGRTNVNEGDADGKIYQLGKMKVTVKQGDILDEDTDCIVNSIPYSMDLRKGAVSKGIYKRCGGEIATGLEKKSKINEFSLRTTDNCCYVVKLPVNMTEELLRKCDLVTTSAPNLGCRCVIHVAVQDDTDGWRKVVEKAMKKAEEKQLGSIAFPALGTSYRNEPKAIAECIVAALTRFEKSRPQYVSDVRLVIYQRDMLHVFHEAVNYTSSDFRGERDADPHRHVYKHTGDPDSITFTIMAMEDDVIDRAANKIEKCYDQKEFRDEIIKTFNIYHKEQLKEVEKQENVSINVDKNTGKIQIRGLRENVVTASDKIHSIMRDALKFEKNKASADLMSHVTRWFFIETDSSGEKRVPFEKPINMKIEKAYKSDDACVTFRDSKKVMFKIDFKQMKGYPVDKPADTIAVVRKDMITDDSISVPSTWASMTGNLSVVPLAITDKEYTDTKTAFLTSIGGNVNVIKIERVQNTALWQQYQAKKKQIELSNPPGTKNETLLWHGSSDAGIENIKVHGFDRSYSNMGCSIGVGVYFSPMATVSRGYARAGPAGAQRMFHCRVLTGEYIVGQHSIRYPPPKPSGGPHAKYDCVVNNMASPSEFVIFNDTQAYPEYLISFQ